MTVTQAESPAGPIRSNQLAPHQDLAAVVAKHRDSIWRKPVPDHTRTAATTAIHWLEQLGTPPVVLDSFCGTGMSTGALASRHPGAAVIGVDQSSRRLGRHVPVAGRYRLFQAECEPFWRMLVEAGVSLSAHYIFYPNPWPKASQLKRRVHGHPGFPLLARLGGQLELRSNWRIFAEEFAAAASLIGITGSVARLSINEPLTLFERKYTERGETIWCFSAADTDNNA